MSQLQESLAWSGWLFRQKTQDGNVKEQEKKFAAAT